MVIAPTPTDATLTPLRALCVVANPADMPRFDEGRIWREITEALEPFKTRGSVVFERLAEPTESGLRRSLAQSQWSVLHLVVHAQERSAAHYGTVSLQSSDGRSRNLTAQYLATLLASCPSLKLIVLQGCDEASWCFDTVAAALVGQGLAVVSVPPLSGRSQQIFLAKLYAGMLAGLSPEGISKELGAALAGDGVGARPVRLSSPDSTRPIFAPAAAQTVAAAASGATTGSHAPSPPEISTFDSAWHEELKRKRASGTFDVFLCHNWADKPAVKRIAQQLKEAGILPWLDAWELPPGQPWQPLLEQQIGNIKAAAVFVGSAGLGPWQEQEMYGFLREFAARKVPVIPVLLPDAPLTPDLPIFLRAMTWVDFRSDDPNPLELLIWGITGQRPKD